MGLYKIIKFLIEPGNRSLVFSFYGFLGHCLLLDRAFLPWQRINPISVKRDVPGILMSTQLTERLSADLSSEALAKEEVFGESGK